MSDNGMDAANATYRDMVMRGLVGMDEATNTINLLSQARIRDVREAYFSRVILPIVRKRVRGEDCPELGVWLNTADGLNNPMNIVDTNGNRLFVCPPAFIDTPLNTAPPEGRFTTTHHLVLQQQDMVKNGDMRGVMAIEEGLYDVYKSAPKQLVRTDAILMLVEIYKFYELPMEELLGPSFAELLKAIAKQPKAVGAAPAIEEGNDAEPSADDDIY